MSAVLFGQHPFTQVPRFLAHALTCPTPTLVQQKPTTPTRQTTQDTELVDTVSLSRPLGLGTLGTLGTQ